MSWFSSKNEQVEAAADQDFNLDLEITFDEEDLNDQSLLDELKALQVGQDENSVTSKSKRAAKIETPAEVHVDDIIQKVKLEAEVEPEVEFHEDDMNDPDLLRELQAVLPASSLSPIEHIDPNHSIQCNNFVDYPISPAVSGTPEVALDSKLNLTDISQLQKFIHVEKMKALNKKRAGDKAGALESLKVAKEMERRVLELQAVPKGASPEVTLDVPETLPLVEVENLEKCDASVGYNSEILNSRMVEFKKLALKFKRNNNLSQAREMLTAAKSIQKALDSITEGLPLIDFVLPRVPDILLPVQNDNASLPGSTDESLPVNNTPLSTIIQKPPQSIQQSHIPSNELISHLITTLESQISTCTKLSAQYFTSNQKDLALEYHKKKKGFMQDKQTLVAMKSIPVDMNSLPFRFTYSEHSYQMNKTFLDIGLDQVEVTVEKATDVFVKGVAELESLVCFDFGWPSSASGTMNEGKGETIIVKGLHPDYKFKTLIKIERSKPFQRFLERKKATFELFYLQKSLFGLMASRVGSGKASVKLDDLLSKCEIHQVLPLMDPSNPRKATGSTLEIKIRLRAPLIKPDVVTVSEQWLQVVFGEPASVGTLTSSSSVHSVPPTSSVGSPQIVTQSPSGGNPHTVTLSSSGGKAQSQTPSSSVGKPQTPSPTKINTDKDPSKPTDTSADLDLDDLAHSFLM